MAEGRPRRSSGRRVSYSYKEAFKDIDLSESEAEDDEMEEEVEVEDKEPDEFVLPDEEEEDEADEEMDDAHEEENYDVFAAEEDDNVARGESVVDVASDREIDTSILSKPMGNLGAAPRRTATPNIGGSRYIPLANKGHGAEVRQRAIEDWNFGGQEMRLKNLFGPNADLQPVLETRKKWGQQETLPSRSRNDLARSPYLAEDAKEKETKALQKWYADVGLEAFAQGQQTRQLSGEEAQAYLVNPGPDSMNLLMGGIQNQRVFTLKKREYMSASKPFGSKDKRRGWTLYLGSRIQDAQWAPNEQGSTQYLAVAVEQKHSAGKKYKLLENPKAPAFTATKPYPGSIQIWAFDANTDGTLDPTKEPRLEQVICTDWGAPKALRWWFVGAQDSADQTEDGMVRLGLLAGIWSDGKVRILDVSHRKPEAGSHQTQYVHYTKATFEVAFPDTIPSYLCWLSPTTLAVGTASGILAVWTISAVRTSPSPNTQGNDKLCTRPWFYKQVSDTYIITVASGYPSRPNFLSITTADGFARLVDLRTPLPDACSAPRSRMLIHAQAWHEHTQSFIMPDEYYLLRHGSIRRFYQSIYSFRIESSITACATSLWHPCVLVGTADGSVVASNGTCKVLNSKEVPWSQIWFMHEWRRAMKDGKPNGETSSSHENTNGTDGTATSDATTTGDQSETVTLQLHNFDETAFSQPLTRITEGYEPQQTNLNYPDSTKRYKEGAKFITIYEENSAVTRVAWNPNFKFGTWAVAGMHSGFLRVEDLGI